LSCVLSFPSKPAGGSVGEWAALQHILLYFSNIYFFLNLGAPSSEFSIFFSGLRCGMGTASIEEDMTAKISQSDNVYRLLTFRSWKAMGLVHQWTQTKVSALIPELREFYENNVVVSLPESVALGSGSQGTAEWKAARRKIVTSSKARAQYTYYLNKTADWNKRYQELYHSSFHGNSYTQEGLESEALARVSYEDVNHCTVFETAVIIRPEVPWLGASLDGTVLNAHGDFVKNIEIKTFKEGQRLSAAEMLEFEAITSLDKFGNLKKNHAHYAQVQLGLFVSGLNECDYVVYSQSGKDFISIPVKYDEKYVLDLTSRLINVYFDQFLPRIMMDFSEEI